MNNKQIIGNNIKNLRSNLGLTQDKFSEILDISNNYLSQIESGARGININNLILICNNFNCSPAYLFNGTIDELGDIQEKFDSLSQRDKLIIETLIDSLKDI